MRHAEDSNLDVRVGRHEVTRDLYSDELAALRDGCGGLGRIAEVVSAATSARMLEMAPRLYYIAALKMRDYSGEDQGHRPRLAAIQFPKAILAHADEVGCDRGLRRPTVAPGAQEKVRLALGAFQLGEECPDRRGRIGGHHFACPLAARHEQQPRLRELVAHNRDDALHPLAPDL